MVGFGQWMLRSGCALERAANAFDHGQWLAGWLRAGLCAVLLGLILRTELAACGKVRAARGSLRPLALLLLLLLLSSSSSPHTFPPFDNSSTVGAAAETDAQTDGPAEQRAAVGGAALSSRRHNGQVERCAQSAVCAASKTDKLADRRTNAPARAAPPRPSGQGRALREPRPRRLKWSGRPTQLRTGRAEFPRAAGRSSRAFHFQVSSPSSSSAPRLSPPNHRRRRRKQQPGRREGRPCADLPESPGRQTDGRTDGPTEGPRDREQRTRRTSRTALFSQPTSLRPQNLFDSRSS